MKKITHLFLSNKKIISRMKKEKNRNNQNMQNRFLASISSVFLLSIAFFLSDCGCEPETTDEADSSSSQLSSLQLPSSSSSSSENTDPVIMDQTFSVDEHSSDGTVIDQIVAMGYENRTLSYSILSGNDDSLFALSTSGELTVNGNLDYESRMSYELVISVEDAEGESSQATITVNLIDLLLFNTTNVGDGGNLLLDGVYSVTTAEVGGMTYLFVAGYLDNGVNVFSVANNGSLNNVTNVKNDSSLELEGAISVTIAEVGGMTYLFVAGDFDDGVSVFSVANNGSLTNVDNVSDDSSLELDGVYSVTTAEVGGMTYLFVAGRDDSGVSVFSVANNGSLTNVDNVSDDSSLELDGARSVTIAEVGGMTYLFVAGYWDDGVSVFSVANNGSLTNVDNVTDASSLELDGASSVTTAEVGGMTYLFVAGFDDDGVSVFSVANNGSLTNVHNVTDASSLELDGATSVTTVEVGGMTYLFVAGYYDDGVSVFSVANNGSLNNVDNVSDDSSLLLNGSISVTTGGREMTYLFVSGFDDSGVSVFRVDD